MSHEAAAGARTAYLNEINRKAAIKRLHGAAASVLESILASVPEESRARYQLLTAESPGAVSITIALDNCELKVTALRPDGESVDIFQACDGADSPIRAIGKGGD